jgi:hypothetical protein
LTNTQENIEQEAAEPVEQVSVVIVSCNRIDVLRASLTALKGAVQNPAMQLIVVDNGSQDGSAALDSEFPAVQFLRLPQNFGLTKARPAVAVESGSAISCRQAGERAGSHRRSDHGAALSHQRHAPYRRTLRQLRQRYRVEYAGPPGE